MGLTQGKAEDNEEETKKGKRKTNSEQEPGDKKNNVSKSTQERSQKSTAHIPV